MKLIKVLTLSSIIGVLVTSAIAWNLQRQKEILNLPVHGKVDDFALITQDKKSFESEQFKGHISVVNFIFTSCPSVCPILTKQMKRLEEKTKEQKGKVFLYSISVDPGTDTPERLKAYGQKYGADFSRWTFLTGPLDAIESAVVSSFMSAVGHPTRDYREFVNLMNITHGESFVVLDEKAQIRAFRHAKTEKELRDLTRVISFLVDSLDKKVTGSLAR